MNTSTRCVAQRTLLVAWMTGALFAIACKSADAVRPVATTTYAGANVVVESFTVLDVQYPSGTGDWCYAPQLAVRGTRPNELFREIYGDFQITFDSGNGARATGPVAFAHLAVTDSTGLHVVTVAGPIVAGLFPTTYTGGSP